MAREAAHLLADYLQHLSSAARVEGLSDRELVERFAAIRDEEAFTTLVRRHGPMVLRVCQRVLYDTHAAEDAFQATFLVLSRKAASLDCADTVGCFLHGVASRLALRARTRLARLQRREGQTAIEKPTADLLAELSLREAQAILYEELARLPEKYRAPLVLCCLEGKSRDEAARLLGWPVKLVKSRLEDGRERLHQRLTRRGLTLTAALGPTLLTEGAASAALPAALLRAAVQTACPGAGVSATVALLAESVLSITAIVRARIVIVGLILMSGVLAAGVGALSPPRPAEKQAETASAAKAPEPSKAEESQRLRTDRYGDPLPSGALARLGTMRWRHGTQVTAVAFSPDGKTIASAEWEGTIHLWEAKTGKLLRILPQQGEFISSLFFAPDGKQMISCRGIEATPYTARVWDVATGKELRSWPIHGGWKYALSPDGKLLAGGGAERPNKDSIALWDVFSGNLVRELPFEGTQDGVIALAFSPDGKQIVSGGESTLRLFDTVKGKQLGTFGKGKRIWSVAFSSDGKTVAVGRNEEPITLWDVATCKKLLQLGDDKGARCIAFSHKGKTLAGCGFGFGEKAVLWDAATGKKLRELPGALYQVWDMAFSADDNTLAVGNFDSQVRLWDVSSGKELTSDGNHREGVSFLAFIDRGRGIATASGEGMVCHWDVATSGVIRKFHEQGILCTCGDLSPDGRTLALGASSEGVQLLEWSTGKKLRQLKGHKLHVLAAVLSPKGDVLASSAHLDPEILLWDVASGKVLRRIRTRYSTGLGCLAWSPDGKILASVGWTGEKRGDYIVYLWDTTTGKPLRSWALRQGRSTLSLRLCLAFSPDGTHLAAGDGINAIDVWEMATGKMCAHLSGHKRATTALAFSADGLMLASGGEDRTVRLWELSTWKERRCYEGHLGEISEVAFSPEGLTLASGSNDTSVLLWSVMERNPRRSQPDIVLSPRRLEELWEDLASEDAAHAWRAMRVLVRAPKQAIPWLKEYLKPVSAVESEKIGHLIADLDSDQFPVRELAARELEKLGEQAQPAIRNALEKRPSLEVRRRLEQLLQKLQGPVQAADLLRQLRSLEVLEHIDSPEARQVLRKLAEAAPEARLTREAKAALERLRHRSSNAP